MSLPVGPKGELLTMTSITKTRDKINSDEILYDAKGKKERPWREKKVKTMALADSYNRLDMDRKAGRVSECGTFLEFRRYEHEMKLQGANFCRVRLCPMCAWRRSKKIFGQVSSIMDFALQERKYRYIFLTLTLKNCPGEKLSTEIDQLMAGFDRMFRRAQVRKSIKGWFRALEVTHNLDPNSPSYDTYHPHFHVILMVSQTYFNAGYYIPQKKWTSLWQESMRLDYTPIVDVRSFKASTPDRVAKSVAEAAKYTVKDSDYLLDDGDMTDRTVAVLDPALANRRLVAFGGRMKEIHKLLALDDTTDGDLIHTDNEELRPDLEYVIERYSWHIGYKQYFRVKEEG
jgi:plasmid rolling circle replication initiator protein Rep